MYCEMPVLILKLYINLPILMLTDGVNFNLPFTLGCKAGEDGFPTLNKQNGLNVDYNLFDNIE